MLAILQCWLGNMLFAIVGHIFAKVKCVWLMHLTLLNSMDVLQAKQLSFHNTSMFCPISTIQCLQFFLYMSFHICKCMLICVDFVGHLC
jgi:hypothetical protein